VNTWDRLESTLLGLYFNVYLSLASLSLSLPSLPLSLSEPDEPESLSLPLSSPAAPGKVRLSTSHPASANLCSIESILPGADATATTEDSAEKSGRKYLRREARISGFETV
jgi:hypothetical protein